MANRQSLRMLNTSRVLRLINVPCDCQPSTLVQGVKVYFCISSVSMGRSSEEEGRGESEEGGGGEMGEPDPTLPCTEDVILKTEQVTKNIQELLRAAQEFKHDR